jgi:hypothetical protein
MEKWRYRFTLSEFRHQVEVRCCCCCCSYCYHHHSSRTALGSIQPPIQWVPGTLSLGVKRPGREADHSPPSSAEVKKWVELYLHSPNTPPWRGAQSTGTLLLLLLLLLLLFIQRNHHNPQAMRSDCQQTIGCETRLHFQKAETDLPDGRTLSQGFTSLWDLGSDLLWRLAHGWLAATRKTITVKLFRGPQGDGTGHLQCGPSSWGDVSLVTLHKDTKLGTYLSHRGKIQRNWKKNYIKIAS